MTSNVILVVEHFFQEELKESAVVVATVLSGRELNVNIYRHTNEPVIKKTIDNEPGIEMQVENLELPVNPSNIVSERISSV